MSFDRADVAAIQVDTDGSPGIAPVPDFVDIPDRWRHQIDGAGLEHLRCALLGKLAILGYVSLRFFSPSKDAENSPHCVIVYRRLLTRSPHEAYQRETLPRIAM